MPVPAAPKAPTNQKSLTPPRKSITPPMARIMMEAEKCGSSTSRPMMAPSMPAKGRMPKRNVRILAR